MLNRRNDSQKAQQARRKNSLRGNGRNIWQGECTTFERARRNAFCLGSPTRHLNDPRNTQGNEGIDWFLPSMSASCYVTFVDFPCAILTRIPFRHISVSFKCTCRKGLNFAKSLVQISVPSWISERRLSTQHVLFSSQPSARDIPNEPCVRF